jgi:ribonuclease R
MRALGLSGRQRKELDELLHTCLSEGRLIRLKDAFGLAEQMQLISGELEIQRSGAGFVLPDDSRRKDIFISAQNLREARHGDRVSVALLPGRRGRSPEGRVVRVLKRRTETYTVRILDVRAKGVWLGQCTDAKMGFYMLLEAPKGGLSIIPVKDDVVLARIGERLEQNIWAGTIQQVLGRETDLAVQEHLVKLNHHVPTAFPEPVLAQAADLPSTPAADDFQGRRDLRDLDLVTIDGETAKDFDDAVCVRKTKAGFTLWVAIADVAHYVPPFSPLDEEAKDRGNSYYFPKSVEPMFPERLSNGLCSLNPGVPRLAMVAQLQFSLAGKITGADFYAAVMQSRARLTYEQVHLALAEKDQIAREKLKDVLPMLEAAQGLARALKALRHGRGSLDFDLPDPEILLDVQGEAADIRSRPRHFSHQIIEEFMIAANEAVAEFLTRRGRPILYRVHEPPDQDKLRDLFKLLARTELGVSLPKAAAKGEPADPRALQAVLASAKGTDLEFLVNRLLLRSQMQAKYSPDNLGHFGLASQCYAHFTSPIRRYADLTLHRALKAELSGVSPKLAHKRLKALGDILSTRERRAMEAEREILKRVTVMFLLDRVGETFTGVISSLTDFGFWVELSEVLAEGLVRLSSLTDDYYAFFPERQELLGQRTGRTLRLGQKVRVVLDEVSLARLEITLCLAPDLPVRCTQTGKSAGVPPRKRRERRCSQRIAKPGDFD